MHLPLKIVGYSDVPDIVVLVWQLICVVAMPSDHEIPPFGRNDSIGFLKQQNRKLRDGRDLLLPRLMSGEIAV